MTKLTSIIFILLFGFFSTAVAQEDNAMIVFDASGSMWGQVDGKAKITIAKKALEKVVTDWNEDIHLGFIAYGHRKKGDCNDIQILAPIAEINRKSLIAKVKKIQPKGKTPISRSLKKAAKALRFSEEKATVILISDGKETCDADPCATAKALKGQGIDFVTHVIGFDVDKQTGAQLKCIADVTGGEYFSAKNASSLNDAMSQIVEKVKEPPKPPVIKELKVNLEISAIEEEGGKWVDRAYHYIHIDTGSDDELGAEVAACWSYKKEACERKIPVGKYIVKSTYNKFKKVTPLEITAGKKAKLNIIMGQTGKVVISAIEEEGGKWVDRAYHYIYIDTGSDEQGEEIAACWSYKKEACEKRIPVGKYIVKSTYNEFKQVTPLKVIAGKKAKLNIIMGQTGKVIISAIEEEGGKWVDKAYHYIHIDTGSDEQGEEIAACWSYKKEACEKKIPVGKYIVKSTYNKFKQVTPLEINTGKKTKLNIIMGQTGKVIISAIEEEGGKWVDKAYHYIHIDTGSDKLGEEIAACWSHKKEACEKKIPVGRYIIKSTYNSFKQQTSFEITAGKKATLDVVMGQTGKVEFVAFEKEGGKWVGKAEHQIFKVIDGEKEKNYLTYCYSTKKKSCVKQLPTGTYAVLTKYNHFKKETPLEIKSSELIKHPVIIGQTGKVEFVALEKEGGKWVGKAEHQIFKVIDGEKEKNYLTYCYSTKKKSCVKQLPIGTYAILTKYNLFKKETPLEIRSGELIKHSVIIGQTGKIELVALEKEGGKWVGKTEHQMFKVIDGEKEKNYLTYCYSTKKKACVKQLPVGEYIVVSKHKHYKKQTSIEVVSSGVKKVDVVFTQFFVESTCSDMNSTISHEIYASSGRMVYEKQAKCSEKLRVPLDNGKYTIESKIANETKETTFTLGGDNPNQITIDMRKKDTQEESHKDLIEADKKASAEIITPKASTKGNTEKSAEIPKTITVSKEVLAFKKGLLASLPPLKGVKECYQGAGDLMQAKLCEDLEELAFRVAMDAMGKSSTTNNIKKHTDWNDELKKIKVDKTAEDIENMKLSVACIDKGASFFNLEACIENNGVLK